MVSLENSTKHLGENQPQSTQFLPDNIRKANTSQFILGTQCYHDTKTRQNSTPPPINTYTHHTHGKKKKKQPATDK